jgi:hypothetical protein
MSYADTRKNTNKFLELMGGGVLEPKKLAQDLLGWLSEADVHDFALANDYLCVTDEDEEESDSDDDGLVKIVFLDDVEVDFFLNGEFKHKKTIKKETTILNLYVLEIRGADYAKFKDNDGFEFKLNYLDYNFL